MAPSTRRGARQQHRSPRLDETQKDNKILPEWAFIINDDKSTCRERSGTEGSEILSCADKSNREDDVNGVSIIPPKIAPLRSESLQLRRSSEADKDTTSHHRRRSSRNRRSSLETPTSAAATVVRSMASSLRRSSVMSSEDSTSSRRGSEFSFESFSNSDDDPQASKLFTTNQSLGSCAPSDHSQKPTETTSETGRQRSRPSFQKSRLYTNRTLRAETEKRMQQFNLAKSSEPHRNQTVPVMVNPPPSEEPTPRRRKSFTELVTGRDTLGGSRSNSVRSLQLPSSTSQADMQSDSRTRRISLTPMRNRERRSSIDAVNTSLSGFMDKEKKRRPSFSFISAAFGKSDDILDDDHSNIAPFADNSEEGNYSTCSAPVVSAKLHLAPAVPACTHKSLHDRDIPTASCHIDDELAEIEMGHRNGGRSFHSRSTHSQSHTSRDDSNSISDDSLDDSGPAA